MRGDFYKQLNSDLDTARAEGLFKEERIITSAQQADITVADGSHVINFCANNYLGLANHPELIAAAKNGMDTHGFGMASVRFICGTQDSHKQLEKKLADFLGIFTFGFSERKPLEESGSECYNETVRLLARLWHQPEKTDRKSGKPCRQIRQQKRRDTTC